MPNNLTIGVGADLSKLRADMALAQAMVKQLSNDLRTASQQSLKTGDTSGLADLAAKLLTAQTGLAALNKQFSAARGAGDVAGLSSSWRELTESFKRGGEAIKSPLEGLEKLATLEIPDIALLFGPIAVAAVAAGTAIGFLAKSAAEAVRSLQNEAAAIGVTTEQFEGLKFAAATVGVTQEGLLRNINRFTADIGRAREEQTALDAKAEVHADKLAETQQRLADAVESTRLAASRAATATKEAARAIVDADHSLEGLKRSVQKAQRDLDDLKKPPDKAELEKRHKEELEQNLKDSIFAEKKEEEAIKIRREKAKQEEERLLIERKKAHEAIQAEEKKHQTAMREAAAEGAGTVNQRQGLSEGLRDVVSGSGASDTVIDQLKSYADKFKELGDATKQANMARQDFGRGWAALAPLLRQGAEGIERLMKASEDFTVTPTHAEEKMSADFTIAYTKLATVTEGLQVAVGNIVGQLIVPPLTALAEWFSEHRETIREWAQIFVDSVRKVGQALKDVVNFSPVGGLFTALTGTDATTGLGVLVAGLTGLGIAAAAVSGAFAILGFIFAPLVGIFSALGTAIVVFATGVSNLVGLFGIIAAAVGWPAILLAGLVALGAVLLTEGSAWENFKLTIGALWELIKAFAGWVARGFVSVWDTVSGAITGAFQTAIYWVQYAFGLAEQKLGKLWDSIKVVGDALGKVFGGGSTESSPAAATVGGNAAGGYIAGPGTGTSDSILARLSNGEFVIKAQAVKHYGVSLMDAINNMSAGIRNARYAGGGLAGSLAGVGVPRFASGGMVDNPFAGHFATSTSLGNAFHQVTIQIGGWEASLLGTPEQVDKFKRFANEQQMKSGGTKPSWYGGRVAA